MGSPSPHRGSGKARKEWQVKGARAKKVPAEWGSSSPRWEYNG